VVVYYLNYLLYIYYYNCRVVGGLLSAHLLIIDPSKAFGDLRPVDYDNELLHLAHDLANRLLQAFEGTHTGIPWPRVFIFSYYYTLVS